MSNVSGKKSNNPFLQATLPTSAGQLAPQELGPWHETVSMPESTHQPIYTPPPGPPPPQGAFSEPPPTYGDISGTGAQWADIKPNQNSTPSVNTQARDAYGSSSGSAGSAGPTPQNMTMLPSMDTRAAFPNQSGYGAPLIRPDINQHYPASASQNYPRASSSSNPLSLNNSNQPHSLGTSQPSSFSRPAPPHLPYSPFLPMYLIANDNRLDKGFPLLPPLSALQPHPFATHDVNEEDWTRLLNDLQRTASLSGHERIAAGGLGMLVPGGMLPGMILNRLLKGQMRDNKRKPIGELIDVWNYYFFHPRRLEVILTHGLSREDSGSGPVPSFHSQGMMGPGLRRTSSRSPSSSSSSSSSSDRHSRRGSRTSSKIERRAERAQRRADRLRERAGRNERRLGRGRGRRDHGTGGDDGLYRLIVIGF